MLLSRNLFEAYRSAKTVCLIAAKTMFSLSRNLFEAYSSAKTVCLIAAKTMASFFRNLFEAYLSALPFCLIAAKTMALLSRNLSEAYRSAVPYMQLFTRAQKKKGLFITCKCLLVYHDKTQCKYVQMRLNALKIKRWLCFLPLSPLFLYKLCKYTPSFFIKYVFVVGFFLSRICLYIFFVYASISI